MQKLLNNLTFNSQCKYLFWRTTGNKYDLTVKLKTGQYIIIRKEPATDLDIAHEIFVQNIYQCPKPLNAKNINKIVDVGVNVGYSCLYWLDHFPDSRAIAFEPHPDHVRQSQLHFQMNNVTERVTLLPYAAGTKQAEMFLTDQGAESTLLTTCGSNTMSVAVVDWLAEIGEEQIDLLKIDIEGGEYTLLADTRFESLRIENCVLEWHNTPEYPDGRTWCIQRLRQLGYSVVPGKIDRPPAGLLWAFSKNSP